MPPYDVAIVGGGIVGFATAHALLRLRPTIRLVVLEKEDRPAVHQSGRNSGVVHSGLYYRPGSLKAKLCTEGRQALLAFCDAHGIPVDRCGKVVVATQPSELTSLETLLERGRANGLLGVRRIDAGELHELEPHAAGLAALHVPETAIVDFAEVTRALASEVRRTGGDVHFRAKVLGAREGDGELVVETTQGEVRCRQLVTCAGLHGDRVARACGLSPRTKLVPFRGEYYELVPARRHLVRNLVYPVPDPAFPFLGVHFTRRIDGRVDAGPNAVLALEREGYRRTSLSAADTWDAMSFGGFWRMAGRYWRTGLGEMWRSWSKRAFVARLQRLVPEVRAEDLRRAPAGVRAQAVDEQGRLLDDFVIAEMPRALHVLNAPSPAATASLAIGRTLAERIVTSEGPGAG